jgi:probable rRNA maturation factor
MRQMAAGASQTTGARLRVAVTDGRGRPIPSGGLDRWLADVAPRRARGSMTVVLVSDARIRALNRQFRGKDYATDVLSFPVIADPLEGSRARRPAGNRHLGDIVIARGIARRQARAAGHARPEELRILALHGLLHLLGYDHERDNGQMARLEQRLRRKGGLREALTER